MFEVYIGRVDGIIKYIGHGKKGRHKHLNSGVSHIYQANQLHFLGGCVEVSVDVYKTKEEASRIEKELIVKHKPEWNVVHNEGVTSLKPDIQYWKSTAEMSTRWNYALGGLLLKNITSREVVYLPRKEVTKYSAVLYNYRKGKSKTKIKDQIPFVESVSLEGSRYEFIMNVDILRDREACDLWRRSAPRNKSSATG